MEEKTCIICGNKFILCKINYKKQKCCSKRCTEKNWRNNNLIKVKENSKKSGEKNKEKIKERKKQYYIKNKEIIKQKVRDWEAKNPLRKKAWNEKNKEKKKEYMYLWRIIKKEQVKEYQKKYNKENKEKIKLCPSHKRNYFLTKEYKLWDLIRKKYGFSISIEIIRNQYDNILSVANNSFTNEQNNETKKNG